MLERYYASGPDALADGHRRNGPKPRLLTPEVLEVVRLRLAEPPPDGGVWSSRKVADVIAVHLGLERVLPQRGWDALQALGYSLQWPRPRPKNPKSAKAEEAEAFKKRMARPVGKWFLGSSLLCLHKRIWPSGEPLAKMESRASWSS